MIESLFTKKIRTYKESTEYFEDNFPQLALEANRPTYHPSYDSGITFSNITLNISEDRLKSFLNNVSQEIFPINAKMRKSKAQIIMNEWRKLEFTVKIDEYIVLLSSPSEDIEVNKLQIVKINENETKTLFEENGAKTFIPWAMSSKVEDDLIFVGNGTKIDLLKASRITNLTNKIALVHYGGNPIHDITQNLLGYNMSALILFTKSMSSIDTTPIVSYVSPGIIGDPLTPGMQSIDPSAPIESCTASGPLVCCNNGSTIMNTKWCNGKFDCEDGSDEKNCTSESLLKNNRLSPIPIFSISTDMVVKIHENMINSKNEVTIGLKNAGYKSNWILGEKLTNDTVAILSVKNEEKKENIYNVVGRIEGQYEPDTFVIIGSHHDFRKNSIAKEDGNRAVLNELAVLIGNYCKQEGWRPYRTILIISWAAKYQGNIGSMEWMERKLDMVKNNIAIYINLDDLVLGNDYLEITASPLLFQFSRNTVYKILNQKGWISNKYSFEEFVQVKPWFDSLNILSDMVPFKLYGGAPVLQLSFKSKENSFDIKPTDETYLEEHKVITQVVGVILMSFAELEKIPYNVTEYGYILDEQLKKFEKKFQEIYSRMDYYENYLDHFDKLRHSIEKFRSHLTEFQKYYDETDTPTELKNLMKAMMEMEEKCIVPEEKSSVKNIFLSSSTICKFHDDGFPHLGDFLCHGMRQLSHEDFSQRVAVICQVFDKMQKLLVH